MSGHHDHEDRRQPDAKDVALALETGRELNVPLPSAAVLTIARASGYERRDIAALFQVLAHLTSDAVRPPA
jgi:3-hydroxyisobutyrate dehydrogenase-like beta-hydroxyacid dehydrogenase